jgi:ABC-type nitrate/sulfonate/bicarbonate transport system substrate-binding protein
MKMLKMAGYMLFLQVLWLVHIVAVPAHAQEKKNLRIVFVSLSWNNQLPYRIAITKGFFKDQGLSVEQIFVRGGPTAIAALISGNVEFGSIGGAQAPIRSNARGLDLQILASLSNYTPTTRFSAARKPKPSKNCAARSSASLAPALTPICDPNIFEETQH